MTEVIAAHILCSETDPRQAAASYLSWLAYPEREKVKKGAEFFEAVVAGTLKAQGHHAPTAFRMKREKAISIMNAGLRRIARRRLPAAWLALRMVEHQGLSIREAAERLCKLVDGDSADARLLPDNIRRDIWYETAPAIPMAMAIVLSRSPQYRSLATTGKVSDFLADPSWVDDAVACASEICVPIARKFALKAVFRPILIKSPVS
ncbi:hypothetical protein [Sphingobium sp. DN12]|uniref:hypothetical protein n=1 Tax=Sphingobium sp. DN12 TaxID=3378073 RepID=UPI003DA47462